MEARLNPTSWDSVCDVAIVGAGPAGSAAACAAANAGANVMLLDRAAIPRYKTCGGGLIGTSRRLISAYTEPPIRTNVHSATFTLNGSWSFTRRASDGSFLEMVYRDDFDAALVAAAQNAGAKVCPCTTVHRLTDTKDRVLLETTGGNILAQVVIGADGSASRVAKFVGVRYAQTDLGLELEIPLPMSRSIDWDKHMLIDWGPLPGSYGWVFPKGDVVTVGVIAAKSYGRLTGGYLNDFVNRLGFQTIEPRIQSGHLTRCRREDSPVRRGRVMVVGDAAGLLEPWTREGISFAIRSGLAAGKAAASALSMGSSSAASFELSAYERAMAETLFPEIRAGARILNAFSGHPSLFHALLATSAGWNVFLRTCRGDTNFAHALRHRTVRTALALIASAPNLPRR